MARTIEYQWVGEVEALYDDGEAEVIEEVYAETYQQAIDAARQIERQEDEQDPDRTHIAVVALVRVVTDDDTAQDPEYAYVQEDNRLPHTFRSGMAVPLKYRQEVDTYHKRVEWSRYEATMSIADLLTEYDQAREQADRARKQANWYVEQRRGPAEDREYFYEMSQASRAEAQRWTDRMAAIGLRLDVLLPNRAAEV
jgi:hypothetical protein